MPRKSASELSIVPIGDRVSRLRPSANLSEPERDVFDRIVTACDPKHFRASDLPLLVRYCEVTALAERAATEMRSVGPVSTFGTTSAWLTVQEKAIRAMVALSMRLRLSPQSRTDPKTLARQRTPGPERMPWD